MKGLLWLFFTLIVSLFNDIAIAAAMLVIAPTMRQAGVIA